MISGRSTIGKFNDINCENYKNIVSRTIKLIRNNFFISRILLTISCNNIDLKSVIIISINIAIIFTIFVT